LWYIYILGTNNIQHLQQERRGKEKKKEMEKGKEKEMGKEEKEKEKDISIFSPSS
jgi:hypothetical protein